MKTEWDAFGSAEELREWDRFEKAEAGALQLSRQRQDKILEDLDTAFQMHGEDVGRILQEELSAQQEAMAAEVGEDPGLTAEQAEQKRIMDSLVEGMTPLQAQNAREWGLMERAHAGQEKVMKEYRLLRASRERQDKILRALKSSKRKIPPMTIEIRGGSNR